jgi:hypothetical protein
MKWALLLTLSFSAASALAANESVSVCGDAGPRVVYTLKVEGPKMTASQSVDGVSFGADAVKIEKTESVDAGTLGILTRTAGVDLQTATAYTGRGTVSVIATDARGEKHLFQSSGSGVRYLGRAGACR